MKVFLVFSFLFMGGCRLAYSQKVETVFLSKTDTQVYYKALVPETPTRGLLVILGGFCTTPDEVMRETGLPLKAAQAGYTTVLPYLVDDCSTVDTGQLYQQRLETLIGDLMRKYRVPANRFIIGGQSLGGHRALYYAEQAYKSPGKAMQPDLVFAVDPPLNMKRMWESFSYGVRINYSPVAVQEGKEMLRRFRMIFGGSPQENPEKYERLSSYYPDAVNGGNIRYLTNVPVRLYCDPDIDWIIENRRGSYATMNATDLAGAISQLKLLGNSRAEFVNCLGKGFKPDGTRHPHYFSMLDPDEFLQWAEHHLEK